MSGEQEIEAKARSMGWVPQDQWRGPADRFTPAAEFVERGEQIMPILRANNHRLEGDVESLKAKLDQANEAIEALTATTSKEALAKLKEKKTETLEAIKQAKTDGDSDAEEAHREVLAAVNEELKEAEAPAPAKETAQPKAPVEEQWFKDWKGANDWFGKDIRKTAYAQGVAQDLRAQGEKAQGKEFCDILDAELAKAYPGAAEQRREAPAKVSGDGGESRGSRTPGVRHTFAELPQEAKDACDRAAGKLVGEGKRFKDAAAWRAHYVEKYFEGE